jgi:hypothetical protein
MRQDSLFEERREAVERQKVWVAGVTFMVPLLVAAGSLAFSVMNQRTQARLQRDLQSDAGALQFELKAAEIVMNTQGPQETANRARALKALFGNRLSSDFVESFDWKQFAAGGARVELATGLMEQLAKYPDQHDRLLAMWLAIFPGDEWVRKLEPITLMHSTGRPQSPVDS